MHPGIAALFFCLEYISRFGDAHFAPRAQRHIDALCACNAAEESGSEEQSLNPEP